MRVARGTLTMHYEVTARDKLDLCIARVCWRLWSWLPGLEFLHRIGSRAIHRAWDRIMERAVHSAHVELDRSEA